MGLQKNLGLRLLSLTLAIFLWGFVKFTQTPFSSTLTQADVMVPLEVHTDADMTPVGAPATVRVTVRGSDEAIRDLKTTAMSARVDLQDKVGLVFPHVNVTGPRDVSIVSVMPDTVEIRVEANASKDYPVDVRMTAGKAAEGYAARSPIAQPTMVKVKGPVGQLREVKGVEARFALSGEEAGFSRKVPLLAVDQNGAPVPQVEVVPRVATVSVSVLPDVLPRMLPVFPRFTGRLPSRLSMQEPTFTPRFVPVLFERKVTNPVAVLATAPIVLDNLLPGENRLTASIEDPPQGTLVKEKAIQLTIVVRAAPAPAPRPAPARPRPR